MGFGDLNVVAREFDVFIVGQRQSDRFAQGHWLLIVYVNTDSAQRRQRWSVGAIIDRYRRDFQTLLRRNHGRSRRDWRGFLGKRVRICESKYQRDKPSDRRYRPLSEGGEARP